ncbi:DNA-binding transcriptional regulator YhcF (GntR family) [Rhizobium esperanzae]|uniref:DNA-binding transcriptional regulator YhcF (GntR family) n=1 Tax=Rhizobium esperanzae TaxID=1967781 RepID=A0A7W6W2K8_9HYPH|nr:DNA-binding transcriptional regulator YhcF (GntR family) [Rhizobium esperanzae]
MPVNAGGPDQLFKHPQLESVEAWIADPAHAAMPLHARIQRAVRQLILDGALGPGKPLPAARALAKSLGVSRDTIESAYSQLHAEGFIERRVGSGSFVAEITEFKPGQRRSRRDAAYSDDAGHPFRHEAGHPFRIHSGHDSGVKPAISS